MKRTCAFLAVAWALAPSLALAQDASPPPPQLGSHWSAVPPTVPEPAAAEPPGAAALPQGADPGAADPGAAPGERPPSSGTGPLIGGAIVSGLGAGGMALAPVTCKGNQSFSAKQQDVCLEVLLGVNGGVLGVGVILLIVGGSLHSNYNTWKAHHTAATAVTVVPTDRGASVLFAAPF